MKNIFEKIFGDFEKIFGNSYFLDETDFYDGADVEYIREKEQKAVREKEEDEASRFATEQDMYWKNI